MSYTNNDAFLNFDLGESMESYCSYSHCSNHVK